MSVKPFDSIRPYSDQEVPDVVERLSSSEALIQGIIRVRFPKVPRYLEKPLARFLKYRIGSTLSRVTTVNEFQMLMGEFVEKTIDETISEFTHSGIEKLDVSKPYLFISNHRDITLDSALLNYAIACCSLRR